MSGDLPSKEILVNVDLANQVTPYDLFSCLHHIEAEDSVLETIEGLIKIGLTESKLEKNIDLYAFQADDTFRKEQRVL
jgi:hypothetical protein